MRPIRRSLSFRVGVNAKMVDEAVRGRHRDDAGSAAREQPRGVEQCLPEREGRV